MPGYLNTLLYNCDKLSMAGMKARPGVLAEISGHLTRSDENSMLKILFEVPHISIKYNTKKQGLCQDSDAATIAVRMHILIEPQET